MKKLWGKSQNNVYFELYYRFFDIIVDRIPILKKSDYIITIYRKRLYPDNQHVQILSFNITNYTFAFVLIIYIFVHRS